MEKQDGTALPAALLTATLLLVVVAAVAFIPADPAYLQARFTAEHIQRLEMYDSRGQQWAHRAVLILVGLLGLGLWLLRPVEIPRLSPRPVSLSAGILSGYGAVLIILLLVAFVLLRLGDPPGTTYWFFQGRYPLKPLLSPQAQGVLLVLGLLAAFGYVALPRRYTSAIRYLSFAALGTYVLALLYLGIAATPDLSGFSPGLLTTVETHYAGGLGRADRIAAGQHLGDVSLNYGVLPSVLLGIWQQISGALDFGGHIRLIAVLQAIALVTAILGYGAWYSWRAAPWIVASLLVLPWMQPLHVAVLYPNQSAWRFLAFCLGVVMLAALHARRVGMLAPLLGFMGGVAALWNPETGICLCLSYLLFLVLRTSGSAFVHFFLGLVAALAAFLVLVRTGLGYWPDIAALLKSSPLFENVAKSYGGVQLKPDPLALLLFVHALFVLIRGLLNWGCGASLEARDHCRIALAALLILWAAYYFNRPDPWNLWSFLFLYGFLVGGLVPGRDADARPWTASRILRAPPLAALAVIVLPSIFAMNALTLMSLDQSAREPACAPDYVISGVCVPPPAVKLLAQKAQSLREQHSRRSILYFTSDVYLMPLMTGIAQPMLPIDPHAESILKADFDRLVQRILDIRPACALFDDPKTPLTGSRHHRSFYGRVQAAIAPAYEREQSYGGWEAWCLKR